MKAYAKWRCRVDYCAQFYVKSYRTGPIRYNIVQNHVQALTPILFAATWLLVLIAHGLTLATAPSSEAWPVDFPRSTALPAAPLIAETRELPIARDDIARQLAALDTAPYQYVATTRLDGSNGFVYAAPYRPGHDAEKRSGAFDSHRWGLPIRTSRLSSAYGPRHHPLSGRHHHHSGVDLAAPAGTPVFAAADGTVTFIGWQRGFGNLVSIRHASPYSTYYAHLKSFAPKLRYGARIKRGERLGSVGQTGDVTGPHLHFEVRRGGKPVDPTFALRAARGTDRLALRHER